MRSLRLVAAAAVLAAAGPAFAQQATPPFDPAQQKATDEAYRGRCEAKAPKELCSCVIAVAGTHIQNPAERQIFFDFMMGDVEKAKAGRAALEPEKNMRLNIAMQKADLMLGEQCDKLKPQAPAEQPK